MLRQSLKKLLVAVGVAVAVAATSGTAGATGLYPEFTIDQSGVSACSDGFCSVEADFMAGAYKERFTVLTNTGPGSGTFSAVAVWDLGSFRKNDNTLDVATYEGAINAANGYQIYALFSAIGTFSTTGSTTNFVGTAGCVNLFADVSSDTVQTLPGAAPAGAPTCASGTPPAGGPITLAGHLDDRELAFATLQSGTGKFTAGPGNDDGDFSLTFNPLTLVAPNGTQFFAGPRPFHLTAIMEGVFNEDPRVPVDQDGEPGPDPLQGTAGVYFQPIPEPGTLVLFGLGLLGVARQYSRRVKA